MINAAPTLLSTTTANKCDPVKCARILASCRNRSMRSRPSAEIWGNILIATSLIGLVGADVLQGASFQGVETITAKKLTSGAVLSGASRTIRSRLSWSTITNDILQSKESTVFWANQFSTVDAFATLWFFKDAAAWYLCNGQNPSVSASSSNKGEAYSAVGGASGATLATDEKSRSLTVGGKATSATVDEKGIPRVRLQETGPTVMATKEPPFGASEPI